MAGTVNKVIIIGHLGRDPETRNFNGGGKVVTMSVATGESWKDKTTGERKERTEWHRVAVFAEGAANFAEQYLRKGNKIYVEGQLETRKWDDNGVDRYSTEVVVRPYRGTLTSLESVKRDDGWGQHSEDDRGSSRGGSSSGGARGGSGAFGSGIQDDLDDDISF